MWGADGRLIAEVFGLGDHDEGTAAIIAAAPEMLAMLRELRDRSYPAGEFPFKALAALIKKASGEP